MNFIFCQLKKAQKHEFHFFPSFKKLKKYEFHLQAEKSSKNIDFGHIFYVVRKILQKPPSKKFLCHQKMFMKVV